jgi:hypothetical protein
MMNHTARLTVSAMLLGLAIVAGATSKLSAWGSNYSIERLTFSGPVGLPGVTLAGGSYTFEVLTPNTPLNIVRVRSLARNSIVYQGFARRVDRPQALRDNRSVILGEAPRGMAAPILVWYPIGGDGGQEFIYGKPR